MREVLSAAVVAIAAAAVAALATGTSLSAAGSSEQADEAFAATVRRWNGDIFWEPASASSNTITRFGDEARAVFGPIPHADCAGPGSE